MQWLLGTAALLATTIGPLYWLLGQSGRGMAWCMIAVAGWVGVWWMLPRDAEGADQPRGRLSQISPDTAIESS